MFFKKALALVALVSLAAVAACADVTGPSQPAGFCPITGGPGVCGK